MCGIVSQNLKTPTCFLLLQIFQVQSIIFCLVFFYQFAPVGVRVQFRKCAILHSWILYCIGEPDTGWSKATDTNDISLTNLKDAENGLTQWFLESFYAAFQCCAKMVGLRRHGSILNPQVTPKDSQAALTYQNTTQIHQDSPSDTPRHPQTASATIDTTVYLQTFKVVIWCVSIWGAEWRWSHHTILAQHWNARFFLPGHFETSKYQNRRIKAL